MRYWEQQSLVRRKFSTNSEIPLQNAVQIPRLWHKNTHRLCMVLWLVVICWRPLDGCSNSWRLLGTMEICMPGELKATPRKQASDLPIPRHNLAHFCCAKLYLSKFRLLLVFASPVVVRYPITAIGHPPTAYMGLAATTSVPMGAQVPVLSPNHHPSPSQRRQNGFGKSRILKFFSGATKQPIQRENGQVLTGKGP